MYLFECTEYPRLIRDHAETSKQTAPEKGSEETSNYSFFLIADKILAGL